MDANLYTGAGKAYYNEKCYHGINQSIGRVIRHINDYAAIILLDSRFRQANHKNVRNIIFRVPRLIISNVYIDCYSENFQKFVRCSILFFFFNLFYSLFKD